MVSGMIWVATAIGDAGSAQWMSSQTRTSGRSADSRLRSSDEPPRRTGLWSVSGGARRRCPPSSQRAAAGLSMCARYRRAVSATSAGRRPGASRSERIERGAGGLQSRGRRTRSRVLTDEVDGVGGIAGWCLHETQRPRPSARAAGPGAVMSRLSPARSRLLPMPGSPTMNAYAAQPPQGPRRGRSVSRWSGSSRPTIGLSRPTEAARGRAGGAPFARSHGRRGSARTCP